MEIVQLMLYDRDFFYGMGERLICVKVTQRSAIYDTGNCAFNYERLLIEIAPEW